MAPQQQEEEELKDPLDTLRTKCKETKSCSSLGEKLQTCNDRVNSRSKTAETCMEEVIDFFHCVDHCATHNLFKQLK